MFIGSTGLLPQIVSCSDEKKLKQVLEKYEVSAWVRIDESGKVTIFNPASEMGQGSMTSLPMVFAEEMDLDWDRVEVAFSPQEAEIYGSYGWTKNRRVMLSAGSRVTSGYYEQLRKAGSEARIIMMHSAGQKWGIPIEELSTEPCQVIHGASGKRISYGELVPFLSIPDRLSELAELQLKDPKEFRLIGTSVPRYEIPDKANGSAPFSIDIKLPGMLYGAFQRGRIHGAKPVLKNREEVQSLKGVERVIVIDYAVGVIASSLEGALRAREALEIEWDTNHLKLFDSRKAYDSYKEVANSGEQGQVVVEQGDVDEAFRTAARTYTADFKNDYVYHAQMEPLNSIVRVAGDESEAEVWVGTQQGFDAKLGVPDILGIDPEKVKIHMQYLGGGFGRRSLSGFVHECVHMAREVRPQPVKLIWTREDDLTYGAYRPMSLQRIKAALDASGRITGFSHLVIGDGNNLIAGAVRNEFYDIEHQYAEMRIVPDHIRLKHWRSVAHGPNKFAIEHMIDQIAHDRGTDPVDMRRTLLKRSPRALATLERVAEMSKWKQPTEPGRAKGVAFLERSGTLSSGVCEISVDRAKGKIRVHHFWTAHDAGVVVHPDNVRAQIEGGIIMGMSSVLKERIDIVDGSVQQSNYDDYQILRMEDMPESIVTELISSQEPPQGVGESSTPLVACAIANAFLALTGKPLNHLPFTSDRVREALNA